MLYSFKPGVRHYGNILLLLDLFFVDFDAVPEVAKSLTLVISQASTLLRHVKGARSDFGFLDAALHICQLSR